MATLDALKQALREKVTSPTQPLSDEQYSAGYEVLLRGPGWKTYQNFIVPQLSQVLAPLFHSRVRISLLEIGPGPQSVLEYLPGGYRWKISKYAAFEPNILYAKSLQERFDADPPLPYLESPANIFQKPFDLDSTVSDGNGGEEKFDVVLFCHSMYSMNPKRNYIEKALEMLVVQPEGGLVVVFHREGLDLGGLVCHRTSSFPSGIVGVTDDDEILDTFASYVAGFVMEDEKENKTIHVEWRQACRDLGRREETDPDQLLFNAPEVMVALNHHATKLPELTAQVPLVKRDKVIKNWEARVHNPASIIRPTHIQHLQECVQWALKHKVGLTVVGGSHSSNCLWPNVVAVDMGSFNQIHIVSPGEDARSLDSGSDSFVITGAGCNTEDIIRATLAVGLTVPLGSRPSVGAGLWLQGGLGHLARLHGLACDAIAGIIMVSVDSADILCLGHVPSQYWPTGGIHSQNEAELLWATKGAGTNFGIVANVIFKAYPAPMYSVCNWIVSMSDNVEARRRLSEFDTLVAKDLPRNCSADAYLYYDAGRLHLGITMIEASTTAFASDTLALIGAITKSESHPKVVDGIGLFEAEMYVSGMHGGHGGGKTSSFKRCIFLKQIGAAEVAKVMVTAVESRPTALCYLHLLQGGGAVADVAPEATAFGCRDWDFACVITGVWPRDQDGTQVVQAVVRWVYDVARNLLPLSCGVYGADLGPDPRDADLAEKAFGPNRSRLARLKHGVDPRKVLAYACPLPEAPMEPKLIILVTGEHGVGKDYCAELWASIFNSGAPQGLTARAVSISDVTKREYATATGADLNALLRDRAYKEEHRSALTTFFQDQVRKQPELPKEHFLSVVHEAVGVDVLLVTGMRDEAPVATLSYLVPESRVLEVRVKTREETLRARREPQKGNGVVHNNNDNISSTNDRSNSTDLDWCPSLIFCNDTLGSDAAEDYGKRILLPFVSKDLQKLAKMVRSIPDFPRLGIEFRHVLGIAQQPGGLSLCMSLFQSCFNGDWDKIDVIVSCEAGGFIYASALAAQMNLPLVLIREAGKLPPPVISTIKKPSHVSHSASNGSAEMKIEMEKDVIRRGASVLVVDDVLATGETLCAVVQLLGEAGIGADDISAMFLVEFPLHRGRELVRRFNLGRVNIQSLLVFGGA